MYFASSACAACSLFPTVIEETEPRLLLFCRNQLGGKQKSKAEICQWNPTGKGRIQLCHVTEDKAKPEYGFSKDLDPDGACSGLVR